mgnify:CR=1 FL=1
MKATSRVLFIILAAGFAIGGYGVLNDLKLSAMLVHDAEARLGRPVTPVSYAGVARRSTVRVATPGAGAPGVGVRPGAGAGQAGVGYSRGAGGNLGGPVNRVGVR